MIACGSRRSRCVVGRVRRRYGNSSRGATAHHDPGRAADLAGVDQAAVDPVTSRSPRRAGQVDEHQLRTDRRPYHRRDSSPAMPIGPPVRVRSRHQDQRPVAGRAAGSAQPSWSPSPSARSSLPVTARVAGVDHPQHAAGDRDDPPAVGLDQVGLVDAGLVGVGAGVRRAARPPGGRRAWRRRSAVATPPARGRRRRRIAPPSPGSPTAPTDVRGGLPQAGQRVVAGVERDQLERRRGGAAARSRGGGAGDGVAVQPASTSSAATTAARRDAATVMPGWTAPPAERRVADGRTCRRRVGSRAGARISLGAVDAVDQPGQDDHAAGRGDERLGPQPLQGLLQVRDVGGPQVHQRVGLAGDRVGADHLRVPPGRRR